MLRTPLWGYSLLAALGLIAQAACTHRAAPGSSVSNGGMANQDGGTTGGKGEEVIADGGTFDPIQKVACGDTTSSVLPYTPGYTQDPDVLADVDAQIESMTLVDKAEQMRGAPYSQGFTEIFHQIDTTTIRGFRFRDGPRGLNLDAPLGGGTKGLYSTAFPVAMARGASFDLDLEYRVGRATGDETLAASQTMILAPTINILRHPAWGRAQETYGEDVFLLGRMGTAFTVGLQEYVPACAKHYAANNIENGRATANALLDEQTLREIYGRHFEMVIKDSGVACILAAYNQVNGVYATQNKHLLTDILRTDFGFKGFVISDWWAMPNGNSTGGPPPDLGKAAMIEAIHAGLDMEAPWSYNFSTIEGVVEANAGVTTADVDTGARRVLEQKFRFHMARMNESTLGLKTPITTYSNEDRSIHNNETHIQLASEVALKSMVLLKNKDQTLPIKSTVKKVAVLGLTVGYSAPGGGVQSGQINFVTDTPTGDHGSSRVIHDPSKAIGPLAGIKAVADASGIAVVSGSTAAEVGDADFVVVVAGLTPQDEGEEYTSAGDRDNFFLDGKTAPNNPETGVPDPENGPQNTLIRNVAALGKPMAVVLEGGSVINLPWIEQVPAVVMAWYPGMVGGEALGKLLFGKANFSGKLPFTWPLSGAAGWAQEPVMNTAPNTAMDYHLGYRHFDCPPAAAGGAATACGTALVPQFPFGYGLSYTTFEYNPTLETDCTNEEVTKNGVANVYVRVKNTGSMAGEEVVFLFASYPNTTARRSLKELKGFYKVQLDPGVEKRIKIPVRVSDLKYWDSTEPGSWVVETGPVKIQVGPSAASLPLSTTVAVR